MRHCRRSTSHFGYDRRGKGWVFERKKEREREIGREDQSGNKRSRKEESQPLVFIRLCISSVCPCPLSPLRQAFVEIKLPLLSLYPFPPSTFSSLLLLWILFLRSLPVSPLLPLRFHLFPPSPRSLFPFSSRETRSLLSRLTRFSVPSACLHLGILSRFCRRARAKFVFERVPVRGYGDEQRFNCWISFSNY